MYMGIKSSDSTKSQTEARYTFSDHSIKITDLFVGRGGQRTRLFTASVDKTCKVRLIKNSFIILNCKILNFLFCT